MPFVTGMFDPAAVAWPRGSPGPEAVRRRDGDLRDRVSDLVAESLEAELLLTPKPGLVDQRNSGAHRDMDLATFIASAATLRPWFAAFFELGADGATIPAPAFLEHIRPCGRDAERAMRAATHGVNTHKGSIFAFGLVTAAIGRLWHRTGRSDRGAVCQEVAAMTRGLVARELQAAATAVTAGEQLYRRHGLTGARGEAASGFATVRDGSLPVLEQAIAAGCDRETALHAAFLYLLEHNPDTNLVARGGLEGLQYARGAARRLRQRGGVGAAGYIAALCALDDAFITRNLSPGGSADLLALTWFLHRLPDLAHRASGSDRC